MKFDPGYAWLGTLITLDVTAWFVWLATLAIARHSLDAATTPPTQPDR